MSEGWRDKTTFKLLLNPSCTCKPTVTPEIDSSANTAVQSNDANKFDQHLHHIAFATNLKIVPSRQKQFQRPTLRVHIRRMQSGCVCHQAMMVPRHPPPGHVSHPHSCFPLQFVHRVKDWYTLIPFSVNMFRRLVPGDALSMMSVLPFCFTVTVICSGSDSTPIFEPAQAHRLQPSECYARSVEGHFTASQKCAR